MILITAILNDQFKKLVKVTLKEKQALTDDKNDIQEEVMDESAKSPYFICDNNKPNNPERKFTTTRIKSRIFLSNISYVISYVEKIEKTFTMKTLYLMFIYWQLKT